MDDSTRMLLFFLIAVIAFIAIVYFVMKSPEQEDREREMHEFFKRENDRFRDGQS